MSMSRVEFELVSMTGGTMTSDTQPPPIFVRGTHSGGWEAHGTNRLVLRSKHPINSLTSFAIHNVSTAFVRVWVGGADALPQTPELTGFSVLVPQKQLCAMSGNAKTARMISFRAPQFNKFVVTDKSRQLPWVYVVLECFPFPDRARVPVRIAFVDAFGEVNKEVESVELIRQAAEKQTAAASAMEVDDGADNDSDEDLS